MEKNDNEDTSASPFESQLSKDSSENPKQHPESSTPLGTETPDFKDAKAMLKRIDQMHDDLERQLKYIDENIQYLPKELQKYYTDPASVIKDHNRKIEEYEKNLEKQLVQMVGESVTRGLVTRKRKTQQKKGSKAQRIRGRNKWISMD